MLPQNPQRKQDRNVTSSYSPPERSVTSYMLQKMTVEDIQYICTEALHYFFYF